MWVVRKILAKLQGKTRCTKEKLIKPVLKVSRAPASRKASGIPTNGCYQWGRLIRDPRRFREMLPRRINGGDPDLEQKWPRKGTNYKIISLFLGLLLVL